MVDKELLSRKLSRLRSYVEVLKRAEDITWEKYRSDVRAKAFVERYLHLAIEEVIDIAKRVTHSLPPKASRSPTSNLSIPFHKN